MIWQLNKQIGLGEKLLMAVFMSGWGYALMSNQLDASMWELVSSASSVLNVCGKLPQIYTNW